MFKTFWLLLFLATFSEGNVFQAKSLSPFTEAEQNVVNPLPPIPPISVDQLPEPTLPSQALPHIVRCPQGWIPDGPHCLTVLSATPYTHCPDYQKPFRDGLASVLKPTQPGICSFSESTGVILSCPDGFELSEESTYDVWKHMTSTAFTEWETHISLNSNDTSPTPQSNGQYSNGEQSNGEQSNGEQSNGEYSPTFRKLRSGKQTTVIKGKTAGKSWKCVGYNVVPFVLLDNTQHKCPIGYDATIGGCSTKQLIPPEVSCPKMFTIGGEPVNAEAFRGKEYVQCGKIIYFKGRLYCPEGFVLSSQPLPELNFGDYIPPDTKLEYKSNNVHKLVEDLNYPFAKCVQPVAVFANECQTFRCKTEYMEKVEKVIRHWSYYKLEGDPDEAALSGIPSGANLMSSARGVTMASVQ